MLVIISPCTVKVNCKVIKRSLDYDILLCPVPADSLPSIQGLQGGDLLRRLLELDQTKRSDVRTFDPENLVHQVDRGDLLVVRQLVKDHPEKVSTLTLDSLTIVTP